MKIFLPFLSLIFLGCAEKNSVSNPCEEFLQNHPEVVNRYEQFECLDSSTIFYELSFVKGYVFFAKFNQDSMWTTQVGNYSLPSFPVRDLEKWDVMTSRSNHGRKYTEAEKKHIKADTSFQTFSRNKRNSFEEFKYFIMDVDKISSTEFERRFENYDSLASFYKLLSFLSLWNVQSAIAKKNDSSFYILGPTLSQGYLLTAPSTGGKSKKIFQFDIYNCCGTNRFKAPKEINANDTSFLVKLQGGNWIYYNEPKDSIAFFIKDSLDFYLITHFKENGDSINYFSPKKAAPCPREYECSS